MASRETDLNLFTLGSNNFNISTMFIVIQMSHSSTHLTWHIISVTEWVLGILEGTSSQRKGSCLKTSLQKIRLCCLVEESTLKRQQLQRTLWGPKTNNQDCSTQPALH